MLLIIVIHYSLCRFFQDDVLMHFCDIGKKPPVFNDASKVALEILNLGYQFDHGVLYYNVFKLAFNCFLKFLCTALTHLLSTDF